MPHVKNPQLQLYIQRRRAGCNRQSAFPCFEESLGLPPGTRRLRWRARLIQRLGDAVSLSRHGQQLKATFHHGALSDPPFSGPSLLNHHLIAQHPPPYPPTPPPHVPSLVQINRTVQIQEGKAVSEREQSLTPRLHATYFEIRLPPDLPRQHQSAPGLELLGN